MIQDVRGFYKRSKKEENISAVIFFFLSTDNYERWLSFLSEACNRIKFVNAKMKLDAVFPSTPNKLWVRNTSYFSQNCFETSLKPEMIREWLICTERGIAQ